MFAFWLHVFPLDEYFHRLFYIFIAAYLWQILFVLCAYAMPDIEISAINALLHNLCGIFARFW